MSVARNSPRGLVAVSVFVQERKEKYSMDQNPVHSTNIRP